MMKKLMVIGITAIMLAVGLNRMNASADDDKKTVAALDTQ